MRISLLSLAIASCLPLAAARATERADDDNLTREFAQFRKKQIGEVAYDLSFIFNKGSETFDGKAVLEVSLLRTDRPLSLDFLWKRIRSVRVNGAAVTDYVARKGSLEIPAKYLAPKTRLEFDYEGDFNKEGTGFQRVVDPEDSSEYLYTDFEPYYAHGLFPCFDQPDLKGVYRVRVDAPSEWKVIANDLIAETKEAGDHVQVRFRETKPLSPYLFFLGAGPFAEWKDEVDGIPLYIWARKSLAKFVDPEVMFATTKKGLRFYNDYFGYKYPFPKYGQIFVPEFGWGGMENPGAVTLHEKNIFRGPVSKSTLEDRDSLILHEMAHMWFGDLVTMEWWNDLWLNESFATYLASLCQDRALKADSTWQGFFGEKSWGYWQDQLVTTHPIETEVVDVRSAKGNFDGITYGKGGAALKQLHFYVGEKGFRKGLRSYFRKFAFRNATREDFISEIAEASKVDLSGWTKSWLQTAGLNRVQARWHCEGGKIASFTIHQEPSASKALLPHRTRVGLFKFSGENAFELQRSEDVVYSELETPVPSLKGAACPDFVYPNVGDEDYALFSLDPVSLASARRALTGGLKDSLSRFMLWHTLGQMVRDSELAPVDFFELGLPVLEVERDEALLSSLLGGHSLLAQPYNQYLSPAQRASLAPKVESIVWKRTEESEAKSGLQMTFFDFYASVAQTPDSIERLRGFLTGQAAPEGLVLDQDRRWRILGAVARSGDSQGEALLSLEEKRDPGTTGQRNAYGIRAAMPKTENKRKFWADLQSPDKTPRSFLEAASGRFHQPNYPELSKPFVAPYFKKVTSMDWAANDLLVEIYFDGLFPGDLCSADLLKESEAKLKSASNLTSLARRMWLEANDELARCVRVRKP